MYKGSAAAFVCLLAFSPLAFADVVSFLDPLQNVDSALGTGDLGITTFNILGGQFQVSETSDFAGAKFFRRTDRGLGVTGGENDEIDLTNHDVITITALTSFNWLLNSFQLRSLYNDSAGRKRLRFASPRTAWLSTPIVCSEPERWAPTTESRQRLLGAR